MKKKAIALQTYILFVQYFCEVRSQCQSIMVLKFRVNIFMSFPQQGVALFVIQDSSMRKGPGSSGRAPWMLLLLPLLPRAGNLKAPGKPQREASGAHPSS